MSYTKLYKETQIETSSPIKLVVILYDIILESIELAIKFISEKKYDLSNKELARAQDGLIELIVALDFERGGDIAKNLYSIYLFCSRRLFEGNIEKNIEYIKEVKNILSSLREAWEQISKMQADNTTSDQYKNKTINIQG